MKISGLKTNHLTNPLGYQLPHPTVSFLVESKDARRQTGARILVAEEANFARPIFDSGMREDIKGVGFELPLSLKPGTRYFWKVQAQADNGEAAESETAWFETPMAGDWSADWITPDADNKLQVCLCRRFRVTKPVKKARMYMVGLGLYEFFLNGEKQGDECLLPGFCDYADWIPYQTFEVTPAQGENTVEVMLGDGWYKGWYGFGPTENNYGDRLACIAQLQLWYEDGSVEIIGTDERWTAKRSPVTYSGIYPGEVYEPGVCAAESIGVKKLGLDKKLLQPRLNPPITVHEKIRPVEVIRTPAGETVLDMGQNMVGWLSFRCDAPAGTKLFFQFGEILQDGCFYNDNLRTAKAEFTYISDGVAREVRQHFTFYGFRYVKVTGWPGELSPDDFRGLVIHSAMDEIGALETSDPLVNQLVHNARWGMKGNFLDVPTDCPQRDERYGWTGDAQIFSGTASYFMDTYAFYAKYGKDLAYEQARLGGCVPDVVPVCHCSGHGSTAWGEAATVIPWNVYLHSGDKGILRQQYASMRGWVDYMKKQDDAHGVKRLWQSGFHYGDWLALDGNVKGGVYGATDPFLLSSAYYYYSTNIVAKAAAILQLEEDANFYRTLASEIRDAFVREYFSPNGRLCVDTMTAYVVVLYMGLTPDFALQNVREGLMNKLRRSRYHLETGFVGTPYLCRVLSENGMNDLAYHLLLEKGFPGWLYEVLMGATTVWERWNSVLPDGKISGTEMNSLNHYAYGSIVEWMFRCMVGIQPDETAPGFRKFRLTPKPNYQLTHAKASLRSASGLIESGWELQDGRLTVRVSVPFDTQAELLLPDASLQALSAQAGGQDVYLQTLPAQTGGQDEAAGEESGILDARERDGGVLLHLLAGEYTFSYEPAVPYRKIYSLDSPMEELMEHPEAKALLDTYFFSEHPHPPFFKELYTLREQLNGPFTNLPYEVQEELDRKLRAIR